MVRYRNSSSSLSKSINENANKNIRGIEDEIFPTTFWLLKIAGLWIPTHTTHRLLYLCYQFYSGFCFMSIMSLALTLAIEVSTSNHVSLIESWYLLIVFCYAMLKFTNLLWRRVKIIQLLEKCVHDDRWKCTKDDGEEYEITKKSKSSEKFITQFWLTLILINGVNNVISPLIHDNPNNNLIFECYSPCDRIIPSCFWTNYLYQCFGWMIGSFTHVAFDCLIFNFIERINTHIKILIYRLDQIPIRVTEKLREGFEPSAYEAILLKECIRDHHEINKLVEEVNNTFYELVTVQFLTTISILCTNIYFLSRQPLFSSDFLNVFTFLCCVLAQNFIFCWYGYKLTERSSYVSTAIFNMNWFILGKKTKSALLFIMMSSSHEIKIFSNTLVNLSPETFLNLVKLSYSAFNLLQQSN